MINGIEVTEVIPHEQKDLSRDVAELVYSEVRKIDFKPSMFSKFLKEMRQGTVLAAMDKNRSLVATGTVLEAKSKDAFITDIATKPSWRCRGVGRLLVAELEAVALSRGAERTICMPLPASVGFYDSLGYEAEGSTTMAKKPGLTWFVGWIIIKDTNLPKVVGSFN